MPGQVHHNNKAYAARRGPPPGNSRFASQRRQSPFARVTRLSRQSANNLVARRDSGTSRRSDAERLFLLFVCLSALLHTAPTRRGVEGAPSRLPLQGLTSSTTTGATTPLPLRRTAGERGNPPMKCQSVFCNSGKVSPSGRKRRWRRRPGSTRQTDETLSLARTIPRLTLLPRYNGAGGNTVAGDTPRWRNEAEG